MSWGGTTDKPRHAVPHLDSRGWCSCSGICCIDQTDGRCKCFLCPCREMARCSHKPDACRHAWPSVATYR